MGTVELLPWSHDLHHPSSSSNFGDDLEDDGRQLYWVEPVSTGKGLSHRSNSVTSFMSFSSYLGCFDEAPLVPDARGDDHGGLPPSSDVEDFMTDQECILDSELDLPPPTVIPSEVLPDSGIECSSHHLSISDFHPSSEMDELVYSTSPIDASPMPLPELLLNDGDMPSEFHDSEMESDPGSDLQSAVPMEMEAFLGLGNNVSQHGGQRKKVRVDKIIMVGLTDAEETDTPTKNRQWVRQRLEQVLQDVQEWRDTVNTLQPSHDSQGEERTKSVMALRLRARKAKIWDNRERAIIDGEVNVRAHPRRYKMIKSCSHRFGIILKLISLKAS
ncbi:hypothetical protein DFS34DRAFT_108296 [Phlyctochytrium arcticum]|nr:hypothetical protein DFS34DRAFT_108296 [Phlyctochytrium arcticum]